MKACLDVSELNLDLSMYPSFVSSLYDRISRGLWIKVLGKDVGRKVYLTRGRICCEGNECDKETLELLAGEWCRERCTRALSEISEELRNKIVRLLNVFKGLTVLASRDDPLLIASAVVLSRRTYYPANVRRWMKIIFSNLNERELDKVRRRALAIGTPQTRILANIVYELYNVVKNLDDHRSLRKELMEIRYIGPKTADAIVMFLGLNTEVAPADIHLIKFVYKVLNRKVEIVPSKRKCEENKYSCYTCNLKDLCVTGIMVNKFRSASGLIQTLAYVYDTLGLKWRTRLEDILQRYYSHISSEGRPSGV